MIADFTPSVVDEIALDVRAWGAAQLTPAELVATRKQSFVHQRESLTPRFLKHGDDQTLASLAAIFRAIDTADLGSEDFAAWSIVSASTYLGRQAFARVLAQYSQTGPWGVPVHVIPNCTPHAISATIGVGLGCHGPSIGVNGGVQGELDSFLSAASLLTERNRRGVWIVLSGWCPEPTIDEQGEMATDSCCQAVALAVQCSQTNQSGRHCGVVRVGSMREAHHTASDESESSTEVSLRQLLIEYSAIATAASSTDRGSVGLLWRRSVAADLRVEVCLQSCSTPATPPVLGWPKNVGVAEAHAQLLS